MKNTVKILIRYITSAAGIALLLLILNLTVLTVWLAQSSDYAKTGNIRAVISDSLTYQNGSYTFSEAGSKAMLKDTYQWAMLLNNSGAVVWSRDLPADIPRSFTVSEVAGFTRWYLNDYPVHVQRRPDGLLVLGSPMHSIWKLGLEMPEKVLDNLEVCISAAIILNIALALLLALLFGIRLMKSVRPIAKGIEDIAEKLPVALSTKGVLGNLAEGLNKTSLRLQSQEASLQKRDTARTTWIAGISHDIRTPLSIVMGYASELEDNQLLAPSDREHAHIILNQSKKIKTLINDLNLASKLEYDMQPIRMEKVHLAALVRGVAADFLNNGLQSCYAIEINIKDNAQDAAIKGDGLLITRAVTNLIANSIQHNSNGCTIKITVDKSISCCIVTVSDNGVSFPADVLNNIKNQKDPDKLQSHGLGLTIVCQVVKAHGGTSEFHNLADGGCEAVLTLPLFGIEFQPEF